MSQADTKFRYISGNEAFSSDRSFETRSLESDSETVTSTLSSSSQRPHAVTLIWSKQWFSVQELAQKFNGQFPVLARVTQGYRCSDVNDFKLTVGQVLHIQGVCSVQRRLKATNSSGQILSIPLHLPITVQRLSTSQTDGDGQSLLEFVNESALLPVTVRCCVAPDRSRDHQLLSLHHQQLTISQIYDSTFLLANPIHNGWLDVSDTRLIPSDLSAQLSVAEGLVGASDDEWLDYCGMFERAARPVKLSDFTDYQGCYYTSLGKRHSAQQSSVKRADDAGDGHLDVQPYIISRTDDVVHPHRQLDVVTQSQDRLNAAAAVRVARRSSVNRRRRRDDVAETSFTETPSQRHDIAVQVSLPRRTVSIPQLLPRMGRLVCHAPSTHSATADDDLAPVHDVLAPSTYSTASSSLPGTDRASTRRHSHLQCDDEGYLTKESTTSASSSDISRHSPVFF